jgi:hypothetical protein
VPAHLDRQLRHLVEHPATAAGRDEVVDQLGERRDVRIAQAVNLSPSNAGSAMRRKRMLTLSLRTKRPFQAAAPFVLQSGLGTAGELPGARSSRVQVLPMSGTPR